MTIRRCRFRAQGGREGYSAVRLYPFGRFDRPLPRSIPALARLAARSVEAVRSAVGDDVDVMIDAVCRLTRPEALAVARAVAPYDLMFFEDSDRARRPGGGRASRRTLPGSDRDGERLPTVHAFRRLIETATSPTSGPTRAW